MPVTESSATVQQSFVRPAKKIATLPICWLEYNVRSLNGRIYPKATCDAIFKAAQRKLLAANVEPPTDEPPTTYVSHEDANGNVNTHLVGAPTKVWQEGSKFWANLDMADTSVARDIVGLVEGKYLRSGSMRVLGVELVHDRNYDLPLVMVSEGVEPVFLGIDLTTRPGLTGVAHIPQVLYESDGSEPYIDAFTFESLSIESQEEPPAMPMKIPVYLQVLLESAPLQAAKDAHKRIHDNLAGVLDATVAECHGSESAALIALVESELTEDGRAIAMKHAVKLAAAHDESAKQCGLACEGAYNTALGIPDAPSADTVSNPDDPDAVPGDVESAPSSSLEEGEKALTEEEMLAALKAKGYAVEAPKTADEKLAALEARLLEQDQKIKTLTESQSATLQRKTQALGSGLEESTLQREEIYQEGDYLARELKPQNWRALADRRVPWPADMDPAVALHELSPFLAHRLLSQEAQATGRDVSTLVGEYEQV